MKRTISDDCGSAAFQLGHYAGLIWRAQKGGAGDLAGYVEWLVARTALRIFLKTVTSPEGRDQKRRREIRKRAGEGFRMGKAAR